MAGFADKKRAAIEAAMRDEVYRTSVEILTNEGFASLSLERLATEIGVSRPTLYNYFPDQAGVVIFIEDRVFESLEVEFDRIVTVEASATQKLESICTAVIECVSRERVLVLAMFHKDMLDGAVKDAKSARHKRVVSMICQVLEQGVQSGELRPIPIQAAAQVVFGALAGHVDSMIYSGEFLAAAEVVPPMLDVLLKGLENTV